MIYDFRELHRDETVRYDRIFNIWPIHYPVPIGGTMSNNGICSDTSSHIGSELDFKIKSGDTELPAHRPPFQIFKSREVWPGPKPHNTLFVPQIFVERLYILFKNVYYPYAIYVRENQNTSRILNTHYISSIHENMAYPWDNHVKTTSILSEASENIRNAYVYKCAIPTDFVRVEEIRQIAESYPYVYEYNTLRDVSIVINNGIIAGEKGKGIFPCMKDHLSIRHMHDPPVAKEIACLCRQDHPPSIDYLGERPPLQLPKAHHILTIEDQSVRSCAAFLRDIVADEVYCTATFAEARRCDFKTHAYLDQYARATSESYFEDDMDNIDSATRAAMDALQVCFYNTDLPNLLYQPLDMYVQKTSNEEAMIITHTHADIKNKNMPLVCIYIDFALSALTCYSLCVNMVIPNT